MADETRKVILVIADISGYTRFMTANAKALEHAQAIITDLLETIIQEIEIPLEVAKLEGDAVFLWAPRTDDACQLIASKLPAFLEAFARRVDHHVVNHACRCGGCDNVDKLRLKLIVHAGEALFHRVARFEELAGVDVILVHRLLKNHVPGSEYVLLTDAAWEALRPPFEAERSIEDCEGVGQVGVRAFVPPDRAVRIADAIEQLNARPLPARIAARVPPNLKFLFMLLPPVLRRRPAFTHEEVAPPARRWTGLVGLVLSPFILLAITALIVFRELRGHRAK